MYSVHVPVNLMKEHLSHVYVHVTPNEFAAHWGRGRILYLHVQYFSTAVVVFVYM